MPIGPEPGGEHPVVAMVRRLDDRSLAEKRCVVGNLAIACLLTGCVRQFPCLTVEVHWSETDHTLSLFPLLPEPFCPLL